MSEERCEASRTPEQYGALARFAELWSIVDTKAGASFWVDKDQQKVARCGYWFPDHPGYSIQTMKVLRASFSLIGPMDTLEKLRNLAEKAMMESVPFIFPDAVCNVAEELMIP